MCLDCGCLSYTNPHGDVRHLTNFNLNGALDANGDAMQPAKMVANIKLALDTWLKQVTKAEPAVKAHPDEHDHPHEHKHSGYTYRISIEKV